MGNSPDPEKLAKKLARTRNYCNRATIAMGLFFAGCGVTVWCLTQKVEHLYFGFFLVIVCLVGLIHNHFFLFDSRRTSLETQQRLDDTVQKQQKNVRMLALISGLILLLASPIIILLGIGAGAEYGIEGMVVTCIIGVIWFVCGLWGISWWRRSMIKDGSGE